MLLVDFSQIVLASVAVQVGFSEDSQIDEGMIRHIALNSLRANVVKFRAAYGQPVIACDGRRSWRKGAFAYYKANRKKDRDKSKLDWAAIFSAVNAVQEELKEFFPYPTVHVDIAEADDVIAVLAKRYDEPTLIVSKDHDFYQLQDAFNSRIKQWDPIGKKYLETDDPEEALFTHIIMGDKGDGVPNILSADNCLAEGIRQKSMTQKKVEELQMLKTDFESCPAEIKRNWHRNRQLVDLGMIPQEVQEAVVQAYEVQKGKDRSKLYNYFVTRKLKNLMQSIGDF